MSLLFLSATTFSFTDIIKLVTSLVTGIVGWMQTYLDFIVKNPIILLPLILGLVGIGLGFIRKAKRSIS